MHGKTLADFRVNHGEVLERLLVDSFTALVQAGVASLDRVAQDGVRVRASAGAASFRRHSTLEECRREAEQAIQDMRAKLDADPGSASRQQAAARQRAAEEREQRVRAALEVTAETEKEKKPREPRASTTDVQARIMKMADDGFRPAFNVQFAADTDSGAIAGVSVDNSGSDMGKMAPMSDALAGQYDKRPDQHLADGGFAKLDDIEALARNGVEAFVPAAKQRDANRDRHAPYRGDSPEIAE